MIIAVTDEKWKKSVGDYVKAKAHIQRDLEDNYSFIGFIEDFFLLRVVCYFQLAGPIVIIRLTFLDLS